jgi:hypothetical protein
MEQVASPVTLWTKSGNAVGRVTISGLNATGVYRSALSVESWADAPITNVVVRNASIEFTGGGEAWPVEQTVNGPGVDARPLPAWGVYARNVEHLTLEDVRFSVATADQRPVIFADAVRELQLDNVRYPRFAGVTNPVVTLNGSRIVEESQTPLSAFPAR